MKNLRGLKKIVAKKTTLGGWIKKKDLSAILDDARKAGFKCAVDASGIQAYIPGEQGYLEFFLKDNLWYSRAF